MKIIKTRIVKNDGEYQVLAYVKNAGGFLMRYPPADYFTNDRDDAYETADLMTRGNLS